MSDFFDDVFTAYCNSYNECASCPLGKETGDCRDLFEKRVIGWAKAHDTACVKSATPATDTDVDGKNGKDTNVPTTLPKWCKKGQWVLMNNNLYKIVEVNGDPYYPLTVKNTHGECAFAHPRVMCPVRFRPYRYEEAAKLIGKVMEYEVGSDRCRRITMITNVGEEDDDVCINLLSHEHWSNRNATIDGVPIGVPEVDEEAMKECVDEQGQS
jgi:hypothetical protein